MAQLKSTWNTIEDKNHGSDNEMVNCLENPDFFDVKKFPFSTISITKVKSMNFEYREITGNLTIKDITPSYFSSQNGS